MKQCRAHSRRALVTIALLLALLLLQLVVVGVVSGGARDHDLTARRAEAMRAFYAAEAGMNMAVRELMLEVDTDGDGAIGGVSGNSNDSDDPAVSGAQFHVDVRDFGAQQLLTGSGRSGLGLRTLEATIE